jgi:hypothetical protein
MAAPALTVQQPGVGAYTADNMNTNEQTCDNVSQIRSFTGATGVQVFLRGFDAPGDGGQGPFWWNYSATNPVDDGGVTTIVPPGASQGCWSRLGYLALAGSTQKAAFSYASAISQVFPSAKTQALFATKQFDLNSNVSGSALTAPIAGIYEFNATLTHDATATAADIWSLTIQNLTSGVIYGLSRSVLAAIESLSLTCRMQCAANDSVLAYLTRTSGSGTFTTTVSISQNFFQGNFVQGLAVA